MTPNQRFRSTVLTLVSVMAAPMLQGAAVVFPNSAGNAEGNSSLNTAFQTTERTLQLQVAATQLAGVPVGSLLDSISFRQDSSGLSAAPSGPYSYARYKITLAEAANPIASMSMTFANNMVSPVTVFDGPLTVAASSYPGGASPNSWGSSIAFDIPYEYQGGDLVLLLSHPDSSAGSVVLLDAVGTASSEYRSIRNQTTFDATTATFTDNVFTVVRLGFSAAVPEPAAVTLATGLALLGVVGWRRVRRSC